MGLWFRAFSRSESVVAPDAVEAVIRRAAGTEVAVTVEFSGDEQGWYRAVIQAGAGGELILERWEAGEEGLRAELNSWAGYLETLDYSEHHRPLMERAIQTRQLFTYRKPIDHSNEPMLDRIGHALCLFLCAGDGFYQMDDVGFFESDGTQLIQEY